MRLEIMDTKNSSAFLLGQSSNCNAILRNLQKTKRILAKEAEQIVRREGMV
jgi:hypothetical protein